ncbi:MAG: hypothetical protein JXA50_06775 [Deltaproteobacteria bacterium]|nr:hypothetical protein [Deltaproteobacteria bacterium]
MEDAPGDIESNQDDDKPGEERFVVFEREKTQCDNCQDTRPDEKRCRLYAAPSQEDLLDKAAKIMRVEWNGF